MLSNGGFYSVKIDADTADLDLPVFPADPFQQTSCR
jgi:hypothetical protein